MSTNRICPECSTEFIPEYKHHCGRFCSGKCKTKAYRGRNRDKVLESNRAYYKANPEKCAGFNLKAREKNPKQYMITRCKSRAKKKRLPFDLTVEDFTIPDTCPVLGIPLSMQRGYKTDNSPSLDRLVPAKGYTKGNVFVISDRANRIKSDATAEELRLVYEYTNKSSI